VKVNTAHLFTCGEFAELCNTTKATLRHYEKYGILKPVEIRENQYRYYSFEQLYEYDMIRTEILCGKSLKEIRGYLLENNSQTYAENAIENLEKLKNQRRELDRAIAEIECAIVRENRMALADLELDIPGIMFINQSIPIVVTEIGPMVSVASSAFADAARTHLRFCEDELNTSRFPWGYMVKNYSGNPLDQAQIAYYYSIYPFPDISIAAKDRLCTIQPGAYASIRCASENYNAETAYEKLHRYIQDHGYQIGDDFYETRIYCGDQKGSVGKYATQISIALKDFAVGPQRGVGITREELRKGSYDTGTC